MKEREKTAWALAGVGWLLALLLLWQFWPYVALMFMGLMGGLR